MNSHPASPSASRSESGSGFAELGIDPKILEVLHKLNFKTPTPIQHKAIPIGLEGKDIIGIAQTGTGKTLAFALPMIQRLFHHRGKGLILVPTRELAIQVEQTFQKIAIQFGFKTVVLIGGSSMETQIQHLRRNPNFIIATPGRILDHLNRRTIGLQEVHTLVLDEADRMLDMGFAPQIKKILETVPKNRQTMLFSATMPDDIVKIAMHHMKLPIRIEIAQQGTTAERVEQEVFITQPNQKNRLLQLLLKKFPQTVLVFSRTKFGAKRICRAIQQMGHTAAEIHSNRSLNQRLEALQGFRTGKYHVLVATDIAARGIDVKGIEVVINYDIPEHAEDYVHRIGRTGRAGHTGHAITFATPDQGQKVRTIERLIRTALQISKLPELPEEIPYTSSPSSGRRESGHSSSQSGQRRYPSSRTPRAGQGGRSFSQRGQSGRQRSDRSSGPRGDR
jgi:ATP-dependent RNA helicase RhlE